MKTGFKNRYDHSAAITVAFIGTAVIAALFIFLMTLSGHQDAGFFEGWQKVETLSSNWYLRSGDTVAQVSLPLKEDLNLTEEETVLINKLPNDLDDDIVMMYRSSLQGISVYVDGTLIYSYHNHVSGCSNNGSIWNIIPMESYYSGREIKLVIDSPYMDYRNTFNAVYLGTYPELYSLLFKENGLNFFLSVLLLLIGLAMIIVQIACSLLEVTKNKQALWVGLFALCVGTWAFSECKLTQFVFSDIVTVSQTGFIMLMVMVVPLVFYFDDIEGRRYHKLYMTVAVLAEINTLVQLILQGNELMDFYNMMTVSHLLIGCAAILIVVTGILIFVREKDRRLFPFLVSLLFLAVAGVYEIVLLRLTGFTNGALLSLAVIALVVICAVRTMLNLVDTLSTGRKAVKESAAKTMFLANMSHEIRTPMNAICAMSEMLTESETLSGKDKGYAGTIHTAADNLLNIINDILDYTKITADKMEVSEVRYSLNHLLKETVSPLRVLAEQKDLKMTVAVSPDVPVKFSGDVGKVRQILFNILSNAVKYTKEGAVLFTVDCEKTEDSRAKMIFRVTDTGIGISSDNLEKLFDAYSQVDLKRERREDSTGLGLAISKGLANLLGGDITVQSSPGWGSTFTATVLQDALWDQTYLDQLQQAEKEIEYQDDRILYVSEEDPLLDEQEEETKLDISRAKVMVVDDNSTNLRIMREMLGTFGVKPILVSGGKQALAAMKKEPDIIFMDQMMPDMDGMETAEEIRKLKEYGGDRVKIIALTANAIKGADREFLSKGFDGYLSKPVTLKQIRATLVSQLPEEMVRKGEQG